LGFRAGARVAGTGWLEGNGGVAGAGPEQGTGGCDGTAADGERVWRWGNRSFSHVKFEGADPREDRGPEQRVIQTDRWLAGHGLFEG
jgi:hypothetical protein